MVFRYSRIKESWSHRVSSGISERQVFIWRVCWRPLLSVCTGIMVCTLCSVACPHSPNSPSPPPVWATPLCFGNWHPSQNVQLMELKRKRRSSLVVQCTTAAAWVRSLLRDPTPQKKPKREACFWLGIFRSQKVQWYFISSSVALKFLSLKFTAKYIFDTANLFSIGYDIYCAL